MRPNPREFLLPENLALLDLRERLERERLLDPRLVPWWLRPCRVRALVVADGLDFSNDDFGLSTFVATLLDAWWPARFQVTLAHMGRVSGLPMMSWEPRIAARHAPFAFDDPAQFAPDMYDVVFLFGIATFFNRTDANGQTRNAADGTPYPFDGLAQTELQRVGEFMNGGGGLFATGDHGALGRFMGRDLPRARDMRLWDSTAADPDDDEVSMGGQRRNDTNRLGDAGSQFDDQSDDVPQVVQPRMYTASSWLWRYSFPHPLLCGPKGVIRVMPDHPHEGECKVPADVDQDVGFTAPLGPEFPPGAGGGPRPLPEVISTNSVLSGTTSSGKDATVAHSFGGIAAYDGHRAGVGRVVTDATWHHFVNINLVGDDGNLDPVKSLGFLASPGGQDHLAEIRAYFRNLGIWLSRTGNIRCMNRRLVLQLIRAERVMEAVLTKREVRLEELSVPTLALIGRHAKDVLGKFASRCQTRRLVIDILWPEFRLPIPEIDPWWPRPEKPDRARFGRGPAWLDLDVALDAALGAALVAVNESVTLEEGREGEEGEDEGVEKAATEGARRGLRLALRSLEEATEGARSMMARLMEAPD